MNNSEIIEKLKSNYEPLKKLMKLCFGLHILIILPLFFIICLLLTLTLNLLLIGTFSNFGPSQPLWPFVLAVPVSAAIFIWYNFGQLRMFYLTQKFTLDLNPSDEQKTVRVKLRRQALLALNFLAPLVVLLTAVSIFIPKSTVFILIIMFSLWCLPNAYWAYYMYQLTKGEDCAHIYEKECVIKTKKALPK